MIRKPIVWKAPWSRIILVIGAFLLLTPRANSQYKFDDNCQHAFDAILGLRFSEARTLIAAGRKAEPANLVPVYLDNYIDFLTLTIGEERKVYDQLKSRKSERISLLEDGTKDSPFYNFFLGEVRLQWAVAELKFGDYATAAMDIRKANNYFTANNAQFPSFLINKLGLGVVHVMVSLVPDNYKWVSNLIGLDGSIESGLDEIRQVAVYAGPDKITRLYKTQASFFLAFLTLNLQKNRKDALPLLDLLKNTAQGEQATKSPLMIYARATILMKNGFNDEALAVLQERSALSQTFPFCYLDYLEGMSRLDKLDYSASVYFERYLTAFRGKNYLSSATQKLAWISLLKGDTAGYKHKIAEVLQKEGASVDEDKQAVNEAKGGIIPNIILLQARLLFDGGYYNLALDELLNTSLKTSVKTKRDLVEYTYRLGRIYHETGNPAKAVDFYQQTLLRGKSEPFYFAAGAAYQMGLLYENRGEISKADSAYHLCLAIKTEEYKNSLHQKAKAGLNRLKALRSKT